MCNINIFDDKNQIIMYQLLNKEGQLLNSERARVNRRQTKDYTIRTCMNFLSGQEVIAITPQ